MNRLGIYLIYDEDGIIDDYILFLLDHVKQYFSKLVIVCNGYINENGLNRLNYYSSNIYQRNNVGFDAGGFKDALELYLGWETVKCYEELVLFNDSFFGPINSFDEMFQDMESREIDFWSITQNSGNINYPRSIQSYFIVINKDLLASDCFRKYWEDMPYYSSFMDVVKKYEGKFALYFEKYGYRWDSYIRNVKYKPDENSLYCFSPYHAVQDEIMKQQCCPVVKKKIFALEALTESYGLGEYARNNIIETIRYIREQTDYDLNLIWENILRIYALRNIQDTCCLRYVLPYELKASYIPGAKAAVFIWVDSDFDNLSEFIKKVDYSNVDYYLFLNSEELFLQIRQYFLEIKVYLIETIEESIKYVLENRDTMILPYKYLGIIRENKACPTSGQPYTVSNSKNWSEWKNIVGEKSYIENVIETFENENRLGLLVTKKQIHGHYLCDINERYEWNEEELELIDKLEISKYVHKSKKIAWWSESFWCRSKEITEEMCSLIIDYLKCNNRLSGIVRILPYYYQKRGYFTGTISSEQYDAMRDTLSDICLESMLSHLKTLYDFSNIQELTEIMNLAELNEGSLREFLYGKKEICIYGAGKVALIISKIRYVDKFKGFLVSDGKEKIDILNGHIVNYLSEVDLNNIDGIILALNKENSMQVKKYLHGKVADEQMFEINVGEYF